MTLRGLRVVLAGLLVSLSSGCSIGSGVSARDGHASLSDGQPKSDKSYNALRGEALFRSGPDGQPDIRGDLTNIHQGSAGDCYFLSSLMALANRSPEAIMALVHESANGTYTGTFHGLEGSEPYGQVHGPGVFSATVNGALPGRKKPENNGVETADGHPIVWAAIIEKLWAAVNGNNYSRIDGVGDSGNDDHDIQNAMFALTGRIPTQRVIDTLTPTQLQQDLGRGIVVLGTSQDDGALTADHALAVLYFDPATQEVTLGDPEGPRPKVRFQELISTNVNQYFTVALPVT